MHRSKPMRSYCRDRRFITASIAASVATLSVVSTAAAAEKTADGCSATEIVAAIDVVVSNGGGTVNLPACQADDTWSEGDFVEVTTDVPLRVKGAGMDQTVIGYKDGATQGKAQAAMYFGGSGLVEISGFTLRGSDTAAVPTGLRLYSMQTKNLRIHHLRLQKFATTALYVCDDPHSPMVIDHCEIGDQHTGRGGMYGIRVHGTNRQEDFVIPASFGVNNPNAVFIEDNTFDGCYHSVSGFGTSNIVFRHNMVTNPTSYIDGHGACFDIGCHRDADPPSGTYIYEIYGNVIDSASYPWCVNIRGGTGIVTDNTFKSCNIGFRLETETCAAGTNCSVDKGCPHSNTDTTACYQAPNQWWVWNNDYQGSGTVFGQSDRKTGCIREGEEYFLRAPASGDEVEVYEKYTYPHPLITGSLAPDVATPTDARPDLPPADATSPSDAPRDASADSQNDKPADSDGCSCQAVSASASAPWMLVLCLLGVYRRWRWRNGRVS